MQWVFGGGLGDHALTFFAGHVSQQLLRFLGVLAGFERSGAGDGHEPPDIAISQVIQARVELAFLFLQGIPVVVVDQYGSDFTVFHRLEGDHVVGVGLAEGAQAGQPFLGSLTTVHLDDRHSLLLEGATGRHEADLALPLGLSEIHHRLGQVFLVDQLGVVGNHAGASGYAHPSAIGCDILFGQHLQRGIVDLRQQSKLAKIVQWWRLLGVDHIGRRTLAFLDHLAGQLVAAALAHVDVDAGLGFKGLGDGVADFLVLAVVESNGDRIGCLNTRRHQRQPQNGGSQATKQTARKQVFSEHHSQFSLQTHNKSGNNDKRFRFSNAFVTEN
ncbi:hypothetical protein D3C86_1282100 [compost metagenome]